MALTTFDRELYEQGLREEGELRGIELGKLLGEQKSLVETYQEFGKSQEETVGKLVEKFQLTREKAEDIVKGYWKV